MVGSHGKRHRGLAVVSAIFPKVVLTGRHREVRFGYSFYPVTNRNHSGARRFASEPRPITREFADRNEFNCDRGHRGGNDFRHAGPASSSSVFRPSELLIFAQNVLALPRLVRGIVRAT